MLRTNGSGEHDREAPASARRAWFARKVDTESVVAVRRSTAKTREMNRVIGLLALSATWVLSGANPGFAATALTIQLGVPSPDIAYSDIYVAQQQGFFKDEGLDVEARTTSGGPLALQIASSGGADLAGASFEPFLSGYAQGLRGKFIFQKYDELIYYIAVPVNSGIETVSDLKGKRIGVTNMASVAIPIAKSMLKQAGVAITPDMFLPVGLGNTALVALKNGVVQALAMWNSAFASLEQTGMRFRFFHHPTAGHIGNGGYFASDKTMKEKPDAIVGFLKAVVRAHVAIRANPDLAIQAFWTVYPAGKIGATPDEQRQNAMNQLKTMGIFFDKGPADQIGRFDLDSVGRYLAVMKEEGVMTSDLKPADVVTNDFIAKAQAR